MMENPVSSPMVPPIADNMSTNFAALSLVMRSKVGVSNKILTYLSLFDHSKSKIIYFTCLGCNLQICRTKPFNWEGKWCHFVNFLYALSSFEIMLSKFIFWSFLSKLVSMSPEHGGRQPVIFTLSLCFWMQASCWDFEHRGPYNFKSSFCYKSR